MIAAGFDPGFAKGGLGVTERLGSVLRLLHVETVTTDSDWPDDERERVIFAAISRVLREFLPVVFGIENQRGVATAARMAQKRASDAAARGRSAPGRIGFDASSEGTIEVVGLAKGCARAYGIRYVMLEPRAIKTGVIGKGGGSADKAQVKGAIIRLFPDVKRMSSHGADAVAASIVAGRIALSGVP